MRNKAIMVAVILALVSAMTLANMAFAAQSNKPANSPPGKANGKANDSTEQVEDVEENVKCTILHKGKAITVSINALPAHVLNHGDDPADEEDDPECNELVAEPTGDGSGDTDTETPDTGNMTSTLQQQQGEPDESAQMGNTETVRTCDGESIKLNKAEKLTLDLHNKTRKENRREPLCVDPTLQKAARAHSKDMVKVDYFDHNSRDGKSSGERLKGLGYNWRATGENLARGSGSFSKPESRFEAWMKSDGHKKNILDKNFEQVGVGVAKGKLKKGDQEETVYTVDFGSKTQKK